MERFVPVYTPVASREVTPRFKSIRIEWDTCSGLVVMKNAARNTLGPSVDISAAIPLINYMIMAYKAFRKL
jgi:hypothetical protein